MQVHTFQVWEGAYKVFFTTARAAYFMDTNGGHTPPTNTPARTAVMPEHTHETAPTQYVEANGIRFAYRRFGKAGGVPIVFNQHFQGTLDHWDPAVTDGLARAREVILFDNAGVAGSSGETPASFQDMGANAITFIRALGLTRVDVLGFSIGRHGRTGNRAAGARCRAQADPGGHGPVRRGYVDQPIVANLRRDLRASRTPLAQGSLLALQS
jgi:pimeloyl-ACP methyl ester carboxylesterase